jgi:hypothetical protein
MKHNFILVMLICGFLITVITSVNCGGRASAEKNQYGARVKFVKGLELEFPDFTLEFVGQRRVTSPRYPSGFLYYDFKVNQGGHETNVSWSSGAGDIGPVKFEIEGDRFLLELRRSDRLGPLEEDELVIWKKAA